MKAMVGTSALIRLILRRDRVVLPIWIILLALLPLSYSLSFMQLYPTAALRQGFVSTIADNQAEIALLGRVFTPTFGGLTAWRWSMAGAILIGAASMLTVIRHTRTEEETGRRELLGATVVGRQAALSAALIVTFAADVVVGLLIAGSLIMAGLPVVGSVALALSGVAIGWVFGVTAAVVAQLTQRAGTAKGIMAAIIGLCYLVRAVGDAGEQSGIGWLSWLSPIGWMHLIRPFANERWWIFVLLVGLVIVLTSMAYALSARRDLGAGLLQPRLGQPVAAPGLRSPLALAWRLDRNMLFAWLGGFIVVGAAFGYIADAGASQLSTNPQLTSTFARLAGKAGFADVFFTLALLIFVEVVPIYAIQTTLRLWSEEAGLRAEPVLAARVGRVRWALSHLVFAALGPVVVLTAFGVTAGLAYGWSTGNVGHELVRVLVATLVYVPAIWVLVGCSVAFFGLLPRYAVFGSWAVLGVCVALDLGGELQQVSQLVRDVSPFTHVPKLLLTGEVPPAPLVWLTALAVGLTAIGLVGLQRRDIG